jgi:hypothetical protein
MAQLSKPASPGEVLIGFLLVFVVIYVLSVLFWSLWLMLGVGWSGAENWSYLYTITHWGLLTPIASSFLLGKRG